MGNCPGVSAVTPSVGPQANACGFHEEARHCQARESEQLQLLANVRPGFHPHSGGVRSSGICVYMKVH